MTSSRVSSASGRFQPASFFAGIALTSRLRRERRRRTKRRRGELLFAKLALRELFQLDEHAAAAVLEPFPELQARPLAVRLRREQQLECGDSRIERRARSKPSTSPAPARARRRRRAERLDGVRESRRGGNRSRRTGG
mgnify:CR=1 FL=1